jgi:excisionase family DNA binding protein
MPDEFLTVHEVAELLKLNQQTVRNWIDRGQLPAFRVGTRVRVRQSDIDAMIGAESTTSPEPDTGDSEIRERLGGALDDASAAVPTGSDAELVAAPERLQVTAGELADRLRERSAPG